jgi:hypothetical protein
VTRLRKMMLEELQRPNEPCKALSDLKWEPENEMSWNKPTEELANFKQGVPVHVDAPK